MTDEVIDAPPAENTPQPAEANPREQFISSLPEEFRADPAFARFNGWEDVAKSYSHAAKMVGMDKNQLLVIPKDDSPEAWAAVYDKLGRPEAPDKYSIDKYKDIVPVDELKPYAEIAHKAGLSSGQFDALVGKFFEDAGAGKKAQEEAVNQQISQWQQEIKTEYGAAYEQKLAFAQKAVEKFGLADVVKENIAMFEHPALIKALVTIGEKTSEGIVLANGDVAHGKLSPAEAIMELANFQSDQNNIKIMTDKRHPQHEFVMKKRAELFKYAYPE